jgi:hypothetical protein
MKMEGKGSFFYAGKRYYIYETLVQKRNSAARELKKLPSSMGAEIICVAELFPP